MLDRAKAKEPDMTRTRWLTVGMLAKRWRCSVRTVRRKMALPGFPKPIVPRRGHIWEVAKIEEYERKNARI